MAMRRLSKSERQKLNAFLVVIFLLGNYFGLSYLMDRRQELQQELKKLQVQKSYNRAWLTQKDFWDKRRKWLSETQPKLDDPGQGNVRLLESLQKSAKDNNLTILDQGLNDPSKTAYYQEVSAHLRVVGSLQSIVAWLVTVQQPNQFQAITDFTLKTDSDASKIRCDLRVAKWYQPGN